MSLPDRHRRRQRLFIWVKSNVYAAASLHSPFLYNGTPCRKGPNVSTAVTPDLTLPLAGGKIHFLLRRLHSLTGIVFGGYLIVHLIVNATLAQRGTVYQEQVNKIHALPWLPLIEWTFIYIPILFHTVYGVWIFLSGQPNVANYPYLKNWFYLFQRLSAI